MVDLAVNQDAVVSLVKRLSGLLIFLFSTKVGLLSIGGVIVVAGIVRVIRVVSAASLARRAVGERFGAGEATIAFLDAIAGIVAGVITAIPTLALLAVVTISIVAVGESISKMEKIAADAIRIRELRAVVRNLDRSVKVADLRVLSQSGGVTHLQLDFFDPSHTPGPVAKKELSIKGRDIYFDAIVLNFSYSEIEEGRKTNIAIPYRVFSDEVPQRDGVLLGSFDPEGVPYAFHRSDDDVYGIAPEVYRERLIELMSIARTDETARKEGILRSLYGSAIHKRVSAGDRLEIRLEQTGGLTVVERFPF